MLRLSTNAYISLANHSVMEKRKRRKAQKAGGGVSRVSRFPLSKCKGWMRSREDLTLFAMPTIDHPIRSNGDYSDLVTVNHFDPNVNVIFSGINQPYLIYATGSDGKR